MRLEATGAVLLNSPLFPGLQVDRPNEKSLRVVLVGDKGPVSCLLRVAKPEEAETLAQGIARFASGSMSVKS